jgi:hypothetical protein
MLFDLTRTGTTESLRRLVFFAKFQQCRVMSMQQPPWTPLKGSAKILFSKSTILSQNQKSVLTWWPKSQSNRIASRLNLFPGMHAASNGTTVGRLSMMRRIWDTPGNTVKKFYKHLRPFMREIQKLCNSRYPAVNYDGLLWLRCAFRDECDRH